MRIAALTLASAAAILAACGDRPAPSADAPAAPAASASPTGTGAAPLPADPDAPPSEQPSPPAAGAPATPPATPSPGEQGGTDDWRRVANRADANTLGRLDNAWRQALREARQAGYGDEVRALGALADPDAALAGRLQPPPGAYRCRTIKLGSRGDAGLGYVAYGWFRCSVELTPGGDLILTKTTGSQRIRGLLYPDSDRRLVLLGGEAWGSDETGYPSYGQMPERDRIGVLERIGDRRWRLVEPFPKQESKLNLLELVPA